MGGNKSKETPKVTPTVPVSAPKVFEAERSDGDVGGATAKTFSHSASTSLLEKEPTRISRRYRQFPSTGDFQKTIVKRDKDSAIITAAIDFGTTYSGYAFAFRDDPKQVFTNYWDGKRAEKTPTVVLMTPSKKFYSFGEDARRKYLELIQENEHRTWYLFQRFKMKLFVKDQPLQKDMKIKDFTGKEMHAIDVFTAAIQYMKDHLLNAIKKRLEKDIVIKTDIHWVITVPAIWNDLSKVFMRQTAIQAGIPDNMLTLALEPEAASLFCKTDLGDGKVTVGCKYIVLDLGGGTADITCHEVKSDGTLRELHRPTGGAFGGTSVDNKFLDVLNRIFGADIMKEFKNRFTSEYWEFLNAFELKKRKYSGDSKMVMTFPAQILDIYEERIGESVMEGLDNSTLLGTIEFKMGKIFIETKLAMEIFDVAVVPIKKETESVMTEVEDIKFIVMVGGFSESPYVQNEMKSNFSNLIVTPSDPPGAVVKGAVIYGHESKAIASRVCKFTYGIARMMKFKKHHSQHKKIVIGGIEMCDDLFNKHIEIGEEVDIDKVDDVKAHEYFPSTPHMKQAVLEVYTSTDRNPTYITEDSCKLVGLIKVDIDPKGDIWDKYFVKLIFGGTELIVEITEVKNGNVTQASVDFLG